MHVHISFLTPFVWLFCALIWGPILRTLALTWRDTPAGQGLAYVLPGF